MAKAGVEVVEVFAEDAVEEALARFCAGDMWEVVQRQVIQGGVEPYRISRMFGSPCWYRVKLRDLQNQGCEGHAGYRPGVNCWVQLS